MSTLLEAQIRNYYSYLDEQQGPVDLTAVRVPPSSGQPGPPIRLAALSPRPKPTLVVALTVVAVILAALLPLLFSIADPPDVATTVPDRFDPPTPNTKGESFMELDWTSVEGSPDTPGALGEIMETPTGLLMINHVSSVPSGPAHMLRSVDGRKWVAEALPGGLRGSGVELQEIGDTYLLVGEQGGRVFLSRDGTNWAEEDVDNWPNLYGVRFLSFDIDSLSGVTLPWTTSDASGRTVVKIRSRFVALETRWGEGLNSAFASDDGLEWESMKVPELDEVILINSEPFAARDGVLVASGLSHAPDRLVTRLFRSTDGLSWTEITPDKPSLGAPGIAATDLGWIAGAEIEGSSSGTVYFSADGYEWTEIRVENDPFPVGDIHMTMAGDTLIRWDSHGFRPDYQIATLDSLQLQSIEP